MELTNFISLFLLIVKHCNGNYLYKTKFLSVPVDHFSFSNNATFNMRYLINDSFWGSTGPIFFYTGNEGDITGFAQNTGFVWEIANKFEALVVFAEHRYYGKSLPFGIKSFKNNNLGYLTSTQALADYVFLIDYLQTSKNTIDNSKKHPVIAFGGSYGGMLAAWIRMKYPGSVLGAIASSAPIFQFQGLTSCGSYNKILTAIYKVSSSSHNCDQIIKRSWPVLRKVLASSNGMNWLSTNWTLCTPLKTNDDVNNVIDWLTNVYSNLAMANYPYEANFLAPLPAYPVKTFCKKLTNENTSNETLLLYNLGKALQIYTNYTGSSKCLNLNSSTSNVDEFVWDFQACTELVMPMCSEKQDMFEEEAWNFTQYEIECEKKFGASVTRPDLAVLEYGGKHIQASSNIIFSNGLLDPWSGGGVLKSISKTILAILIPDAAHHLDLRSSNESDPESVVNARNFHERAIHRWLKSFYNHE